jgi:NAD(P)-dependent dehydrogenase (short-subunit alcohol dehydrogenase family)
VTNDRWALVAGASRGLGWGLAIELQQRGWNVVATVRDTAGERRLQQMPAAEGGMLRVEHVDINDDEGVARLRQRLDELSFDLVFVNAGIAPDDDDPIRIGREVAAHVLLTNALAPIRFAGAFLDRVKDGPGIIAFMSSGLGSVSDKTDDYGPLSAPARRRSIRCRAALPPRSAGGGSPCSTCHRAGCAPIWAGPVRRSVSKRACVGSSICWNAVPAACGTVLSITAAVRCGGDGPSPVRRSALDSLSPRAGRGSG